MYKNKNFNNQIPFAQSSKTSTSIHPEYRNICPSVIPNTGAYADVVGFRSYHRSSYCRTKR